MPSGRRLLQEDQGARRSKECALSASQGCAAYNMCLSSQCKELQIELRKLRDTVQTQLNNRDSCATVAATALIGCAGYGAVAAGRVAKDLKVVGNSIVVDGGGLLKVAAAVFCLFGAQTALEECNRSKAVFQGTLSYMDRQLAQPCLDLVPADPAKNKE